MNNLDECWDWVLRAHNEGWKHKKRNIKMDEVSLDQILLRVMEEVGELSQAHTRDGNELEELADSLAIIMHFAIAKGFSRTEVVDKIKEKLEYHIVPPVDKEV